jgi:hypothetical protein
MVIFTTFPPFFLKGIPKKTLNNRYSRNTSIFQKKISQMSAKLVWRVGGAGKWRRRAVFRVLAGKWAIFRVFG